jgi:HSP20 family protein
MTLLKFDPMRGFESVARKMSEMAGELEKGFSFEYGGFAPRVDISEDDKSLYVHVELPGVNKDDVKLSINEDNILSIKGLKKGPEKLEDRTCIRTERAFGEFSRSFLLPDFINRDGIEAKYEHGVLNLTIQKKEPEKPKEVEIKIG